jgi:hypothetical protein
MFDVMWLQNMQVEPIFGYYSEVIVDGWLVADQTVSSEP